MPPASGLEHWNGTNWQPYQLSAGLSLVMDMDMVASDDVWAVGGDGYIFHWDGTSWSRQPSPGGSLFGVSIVSATDGWAVGGDGSSGRIVHYDGTRWVDYPISTTRNIHAIDMVDANEGWAGGDSPGILLRYRSSPGLTATPSATRTPTPPAATPTCGPAWSVITSPNPCRFHQLQAVSARSANDVWTVGFHFNDFAQALAMHWDGENWTVYPGADPGTQFSDLNGVAAISANNVWAVGEYGTGGVFLPMVEHWDGS